MNQDGKMTENMQPPIDTYFIQRLFSSVLTRTEILRMDDTKTEQQGYVASRCHAMFMTWDGGLQAPLQYVYSLVMKTVAFRPLGKRRTLNKQASLALMPMVSAKTFHPFVNLAIPSL